MGNLRLGGYLSPQELPVDAHCFEQEICPKPVAQTILQIPELLLSYPLTDPPKNLIGNRPFSD